MFSYELSPNNKKRKEHSNFSYHSSHQKTFQQASFLSTPTFPDRMSTCSNAPPYLTRKPSNHPHTLYRLRSNPPSRLHFTLIDQPSKLRLSFHSSISLSSSTPLNPLKKEKKIQQNRELRR